MTPSRKACRLSSFHAALFVFVLFPFLLFAQNLEIHHINVQQGTSVLVVGPDGTTLLFDGGRPGKGTSEVAPYLQSLGITSSLDYMVLSHRDSDHYSGLTELINNAGYDVLNAVYDNGSDKTSTTIQDFLDAAATTTAGGAVPITLGQVISLGNGAVATCVVVNGDVIGVGPVSGALNNENDRSVGLLIEYGDFDFLIAGDLGGGDDDNACTGRSTGQVNVETPLVQSIMPGGANPLLSSFGVEVHHVNHHGSESSTNSEIMNLLSPAAAMISVGASQGGSFHHPRQDVVDNVLLAQASCVTAAPALVLQTEEGSPTGTNTSFSGFSVGDITITTDGVSDYTISASGAVSQGPDERVAAGLPVTLPFEESGSTGSSTLVISEVFYDTPGTDSQEEWIELYNYGTNAVDASGWTLTDNNGSGGTLTLPSGSIIAPMSYFTVAKNQTGFFALYGYDADVYASFPGLNNNGDALVLNDGSAQLVDAVGWEGGASQGVPAGWGSSTEPNAPTGNTIVRTDPNVDTGTFSDWSLAINNGDPQTQATVNTLPIAVANGPYSGTAGQPITFTSVGSIDPDGTIVSYLWDFGDNNTSIDPNPTHTYASSGTFNVSLTVTDDDGGVDTDNTTASISTPASTTIVVSEVFYDTPGTDSQEEWIELYNTSGSTVDVSGWTITDNNGTGASFTIPAGATIAPSTYLTVASDQTGFVALYGYEADVYGNIPGLNNTGDAIILTDDAAEEIDAVAWEGGASAGVPTGWGSSSDPNAPTGSTIVRTDPNADSNTFSDWSLAANNGDPQTQGSTNVAPIALANGPYNGSEGQPIAFSSAGSNDPDGTIVSYDWDFGDNNTSTLENPTHTYAAPGTYTVMLTVTDDGGLTDTDVTTAEVSAVGGAAIRLAQGVLTNVGDAWTTVTLAETYNSMVVVGAANYSSSDLPAVVRIRNAVGNSFDVSVQNPSGSALSGVTVHYLAMEEGTYTQASDGVTMEAVKFTSSVTDRKGSWNGESRSYANSYSSPVVVGQVMTDNDPEWSVFWASNGSRNTPPSASSLSVGKHVGEDGLTSRADETIGYIVIEAGSGTIEGTPFSAGLGADNVRGVGNSPPYTYSLSGLSSASAAVVSAAAMDGNDGGWPMLYGGSPFSSTSLALAFDEDQLNDSERRHTTEQVAYLALGTGLAKVASLDAPAEPMTTIEDFALHQNYPNPFNPSTRIDFELVEAADVSLRIYNTRGQLVRTLAAGSYGPGRHTVMWHARDDASRFVPSGVYLYRLEAGEFRAQRKLTLMK